MMLHEMKCTRIPKNTPPMTPGQAEEKMGEVPEWLGKDEVILREFKFKDFFEAIAFVNKVADLANAEDHHPDIYISYSKVRLELTTHSIGGLSMNDFILAAKIDRI
jgi:4a-hydroxytetrahydrobiopterin dehydratase